MHSYFRVAFARFWKPPKPAAFRRAIKVRCRREAVGNWALICRPTGGDVKTEYVRMFDHEPRPGT